MNVSTKRRISMNISRSAIHRNVLLLGNMLVVLKMGFFRRECSLWANLFYSNADFGRIHCQIMHKYSRCAASPFEGVQPCVHLAGISHLRSCKRQENDVHETPDFVMSAILTLKRRTL